MTESILLLTALAEVALFCLLEWRRTRMQRQEANEYRLKVPAIRYPRSRQNQEGTWVIE